MPDNKVLNIVNEPENIGFFGGVNGGVSGGVNGGVSGGVSKNVKEKLDILLNAIAEHEGKRAPDYMKAIEVPERTIQRYLQQLKEDGLKQ
jgi:ATP-dependent DNA helicase RecG